MILSFWAILGVFWWLPRHMLVALTISSLRMKCSLNLIGVYGFYKIQWVILFISCKMIFTSVFGRGWVLRKQIALKCFLWQVQDLPTFGIGHSLGSVIHLLIGILASSLYFSHSQCWTTFALYLFISLTWFICFTRIKICCAKKWEHINGF